MTSAAGSEVYITHRGVQEVYTNTTKDSTVWQPRPSDPQLEATFLARLMSKLGVTDIFGEDVGPPLGGVFTATQGLRTAWNTPLDERGIIGAAIGLGLAKRRCVAEIQFCDYIYNTIDLLKLAGMQSWTSNGDWYLPMTVMTPTGAGIFGSIYHSHSFDATMTHIPGWKTVMPSTPLTRPSRRLWLPILAPP